MANLQLKTQIELIKTEKKKHNKMEREMNAC